MVELPKNPENDFYVDRSLFRDDLQALLQVDDATNIFLGDTGAIFGTGKTTTMAKLYYEMKEQDKLQPIWLGLSTYSITFNNPKAEDLDSLAIIQQNLTSFKSLLYDLGNQIDPGVFDILPERIIDLTQKYLKELFTINNTFITGDVQSGSFGKISESELKSGDINVNQLINLDQLPKQQVEAIQAII